MRRKQLFRTLAMLLVVALVGQNLSPMKSYAEEEQQEEQSVVTSEEPEPEPLPVSEQNDEEEAAKKAAEEEAARKAAEEAAAKQAAEEEAAKKAAEEEAAKKAAEEEAAKKAAEEEAAKKAAEEEAAKKAAEEEAAKKAAEEEAAEEEAAKKAAEEEAAKKAEEEAKSKAAQEEEAAKEEAIRKAQEEEEAKKQKVVGETNWMKLSSNAISFGQLEKGKQDVDYKVLKVTNAGTETHSIAWSLTDPDNEWNVDAPTNVDIPAGNSVTFTISPKTGTEGSFKGTLVVAELDASQAVVQQVFLSVTIYAKAVPYVNSVRISPGTMTLAKGGSGSFAASVDCGNGAGGGVNWSVSGNSSSGTTINSTGDLTIGADETASQIGVVAVSKDDPTVQDEATVKVISNSYTITASADPYYGGSVAGGGTFEAGKEIQLVAAPASGYEFQGWYKGDAFVTLDKHVNITVKENESYVAKFSQTGVRVTTNLNNGKAGWITQSQTVAYGGSLKLEAVAADGYRFDGWYEGTTKLSGDATFTLTNITSERYITAAFMQTAYTVTGHITPDKSGVIEGLGSFEKGENVHLEAAPLDGYEFVSWVINGREVSKDTNYTIKKIDRDISITAVFAKKGTTVKTYVIEASAGANGVISPSGKAEIQENATVAYSIVANKGYVVSDVKVDGKSVGAVTFYKFKKVKGPHTITAEFKQKTVTAQTAKKATEEKKEAIEKAEDRNVVTGDVSEVMDYQENQGVLDTAGITEDTARDMIKSGDDRILMELALYKEYLHVTVTNEFADDPCETDEKSYYDIDSVPNMSDIVNSVLSEDEKIEIFKGVGAKLNVNIQPDEDYPDSYKELMKSETEGKAEIKSYFDISFIKTMDNTPELITDLPVGMKIVMNVPEDLKDQGEICIVRLHENSDGTKTVDILENEGTEEGKVTVTTDKLSAYAFAIKTEAASDGEKAETSDDSAAADSSAADSEQSQDTAKEASTPIVPIVVGIVVVAAGAILAYLGISKKRK